MLHFRMLLNISNVTQHCRCSPMLIFRAWATCAKTAVIRKYFCGRLKMLSPSIAFRGNLLSLRTQYLKPLSVCWRSQKTEARHLESQGSLDGLRSFGEIPQRNRWRFMYDVITKTEGFTKPFKFLERLFDELGPIYKEDFTMRPSTTVHVIDPDDFEKTLRAEGKYPQRPILDFHLEHRRRRNYFPGLPNL